MRIFQRRSGGVSPLKIKSGGFSEPGHALRMITAETHEKFFCQVVYLGMPTLEEQASDAV